MTTDDKIIYVTLAMQKLARELRVVGNMTAAKAAQTYAETAPDSSKLRLWEILNPPKKTHKKGLH